NKDFLERMIMGPIGTRTELQKVKERIKIIKDEQDRVVGRAAIIPPSYYHSQVPELRMSGVAGAVTVGGLRSCRVAGIFWLLTGKSIRAARDVAVPLVSSTQLAAWATEQVSLLTAEHTNGNELRYSQCASIAYLCGGEPNELPIARVKNGWVTTSGLIALIA